MIRAGAAVLGSLLVLALLGATSAHAAVNFRVVQAPAVAGSSPTSSPTAAAATPTASTTATSVKSRARPLYIEGQVIVRFKRGTSATKEKAVHKIEGARVVRKLLLPNTYVVEFRTQRKPRDVANEYQQDASVRYAEPNYLRQPVSTLPNDTSFGEQWGLHNVGQTVNGSPGTAGADIGATDIWDTTTGSDNVVVGVVDTGVDKNHSDISPNLWVNNDPPGGGDNDLNGVIDDTNGYDFLDDDADPMDTVGHGTHVAGVLGARGNNSNGVAGVAWRTKIAIMRVCDELGCDDAAIADAFTYAGIEGMRVVNASISGPTDPPDTGSYYSNTVAAAVASSPNTLFVTSSGNGGDDEVGDNNDAAPQYPCNYTAANVVCVAATDRNDKLASFSNYGNTSVDVAAPGQYILSTWKQESGQDRYAFQSGTSQATAMVSGAAALDLAQNPNATTATLRSDITGNADALPSLAGRVATGGRLKIGFPGPAEPPPTSSSTDLDTTFNGTGKAIIGVPGSTLTVPTDLVLQSDGKVVIGGYATIGGSNDFFVARMNTNGTMDTSFSGDGWATASLTAGNDYINSIALQTDGKIVAAGWANQTDFGMARFNTNGTLDTGFDGDGLATTDINGQDQALGVAIANDGKIVAVGWRGGGADIAAARYNTNGSLDTGFDGDGKLETDLGNVFEEAHAVAIQSDNKIVAAGGTFPFGAGPADFAVLRYNTNGSLDTSFDGDGKVFTDWGGRQDSPSETANAVSILSTGKIVVAGQVPDATTTTLWRFAVARYNTNGSLDGTFGTGGKATADVSGHPTPAVSGDVTARELAIAPTGEVVLAGWSYPAGFQNTIARFTSAGARDTTLGPGGVSIVPTFCQSQEKLMGVAIQPNRRMVVAGQNCGSNLAPVARLNGSSASVFVTPNTEMNPSGQSVGIAGFHWPLSTTVQIQQCNETGSPVCVTVANLTTDSIDGNFQTAAPPSLTYAATGGSCPDPNCKIVVTAPNGEVVKVPISFKATTSITATPSRGVISQGDAIQTGQAVTVKADLNGGTSGSPTGSVNFFWCGPLLHPTTCAAGGTSIGSQSLTNTGGSGATATSPSVSFPSAGRYCFRAAYAGDGVHRSATDSSRETCISVRATPGAGPLAVDDFYEGLPGQPIPATAPGVLENDLSGPALPATAQLVSGPTNGTLTGGLATNGSFTYTPNNALVTSDSFTYRAQNANGLSDITTVSLSLTGDPNVAGSRYRGSRYHGSRYRGSRYHGSRYRGSRYRGSRYRTLDEASMTTYAECSARWVWVNPQITVFEQTTLEISAALYDANGVRIATSDGFLADGEFYGDLSDPLDVAWPVWNEPAPAGGAYAKVFLTADPADPNNPNYTIENTVGCQT